MTSWWQPGQLLFAGFEGTAVPPALKRLIGQGRLGGVILFSRNLRDPHAGGPAARYRRARELVASIARMAPPDAPITVAIDQEGGRVQRLRTPWTEWPPMRALGDRDEPATTRAVARGLARELAELGIGLDFAPVVDVDTNPANPVIGDRSFSRDPERVARHAAEFIEAMQSAGVAACAKHFPGHGDTHSDSHLELPRLPHDLDRLRAVELAPFRAAVEADVASIMTAHVVFEAIDPRRPATLSPDVMALLREEIGFQGLVFSDDLEMKAVADHHRPESLVRGTVEAGVDALLVCRQLDLVLRVLELLERLPDALVERALERLVAFKKRFAPPVPAGPADDPAHAPPYPEHQDLARRVEQGTP
jgi:beta-N-acetylhexosaminidase